MCVCVCVCVCGEGVGGGGVDVRACESMLGWGGWEGVGLSKSTRTWKRTETGVWSRRGCDTWSGMSTKQTTLCTSLCNGWLLCVAGWPDSPGSCPPLAFSSCSRRDLFVCVFLLCGNPLLPKERVKGLCVQSCGVFVQNSYFSAVL